MWGAACSSKAKPEAAVPVAQPPAPPPLPGLTITQYPEPVFSGWYALLRVGPRTPGAPTPTSAPVAPPTSSAAPTALEPRHDEALPLRLPPILLVHGLGPFGMADFFPLLEELSRQREVLVVDLPGFGRSTRANKEYSPEAYARFLAHVVDTHVGSAVDVAGHSMGGALSIALAGSYPNRVRRLAVIDAAGVLYRESLVYEMQNAPADEPEVNVLRLVGRDLWRAALGLTSPFFDPGVVLSNAMLRGQVLNGDPMKIAALSLVEHSFDRELSALSSPTLLMWGDQDMTAPLRTFHLLRERLPVWESHLLPGVGHNPMTASPARVSQQLLRFFDAPQLGSLEPKRPGPSTARQGVCSGQPAALFEGNYSTLDITQCREVMVRNAVVGTLRVRNSNVELRSVTVEQGVSLWESHARATGGIVRGEVALELHDSSIDMAGVEVLGTELAVSVKGSAIILGSVSGVTTTRAGRHPIHGRHRLADGTQW